MRLIAALLFVLHGLAHFVGFRAAFWPAPIQFRGLVHLPRRIEGVAWLLLGIGFIGVAALLLLHHEAWQKALFLAAGGSLLMCAMAWPDAKIGFVIDAVLLVMALLLSPANTGPHLTTAFERELDHAVPPAPVPPVPFIDERSIATLPPPVQRYLQFMGVVGQRRDVSIRATFSARFRRDQGDWLPCEVMQYDSRAPVTRVYMMQLSLRHLLPVTVRDKYVGGRGTLEAKAFDVVEVAKGNGHELDIGELVTYLNDALLMAPSLLLGPETTWTAVDAATFDVALTDGPLVVKGRVSLDARGGPRAFSTTDRFFEMPDGRRVRTEWRTPIYGWQDVGGRKLPTRAQAVWVLPSGPFAYADFTFEPTRITFNGPH